MGLMYVGDGKAKIEIRCSIICCKVMLLCMLEKKWCEVLRRIGE